MEESGEFVEKQLSSLREKVERLETIKEELGLKAVYMMQTAIGQKALRTAKMKTDVTKLEERVAKKTAAHAASKPINQFTDRKTALRSLISAQKASISGLLPSKTQTRTQLTQLKSTLARLTEGLGAENVTSCVQKYQETLNSVETLSQQAQYLLLKVTEAEKEKQRLEMLLEFQLPVWEKTPKRSDSVSFPSAYEEEPKWVSYARSSFSILLNAIDQADFYSKLGPKIRPNGLELVLLIGKKLFSAWEIATQRGKIKAKISGSRKLRNITKASILNKVALPRHLVPVNLKQIQWEVNALKEKMYKSHFVRDVCLSGSALSPQVKISSSERLEGLLTGAAGLKYRVREQIKEKIGEIQTEMPETPFKDSSEADFAISVKNSQKNRSVALSMFSRNRTEIFRNMFSVAVNMKKRRLRTVSSSGNVHSCLEDITGIHGIERELRTLSSQLHSLTLAQGKDAMPSLKQVYCDMAVAKKRTRLCFTSKPCSRLSSPEERVSSKLSKYSSKVTDSQERRLDKLH